MLSVLMKVWIDAFTKIRTTSWKIWFTNLELTQTTTANELWHHCCRCCTATSRSRVSCISSDFVDFQRHVRHRRQFRPFFTSIDSAVIPSLGSEQCRRFLCFGSLAAVMSVLIVKSMSLIVFSNLCWDRTQDSVCHVFPPCYHSASHSILISIPSLPSSPSVEVPLLSWLVLQIARGTYGSDFYSRGCTRRNWSLSLLLGYSRSSRYQHRSFELSDRSCLVARIDLETSSFVVW